jgi:hypothetical protein
MQSRRTPREDEGRDQVIHLQAKKHQRWPASHQELGERHGTDSPSQPSEGPTLPAL